MRFSRPLQIAFVSLALMALACTCGVPAAFRRPTPTPTPASSYPPSPPPQATAPSSGAATADPVQKWEQAVRTSATTGGPIDVTFTEAELTALLMGGLDQRAQTGQPVPLTQPQVRLTNGQVWLSGLVTLSGSPPVHAQIALTPAVQDGTLTVTIDQVNLGGLPVPSALLDELNRQIAVQLANVDREMGVMTLTDVTVREGELRVTGVLK